MALAQHFEDGSPYAAAGDDGRWGGGRMLSLPEQIAERVGRRILGGEIAPGARITEQQVVDEIGVSRAPVREAFRILEKDGLIRIHPRRGVTATPLTRKDFGDIAELAQALYVAVGSNLARSKSPQAIALLEREIPALERATRQVRTSGAFTEAANRIRQGLAHATGNSRLEASLRSLSLESYRYRVLAHEPQASRLKSVAGWRKLLGAIRQGNRRLAEKTMTELVSVTRASAMPRLPESEDAGENGNGNG